MHFQSSGCTGSEERTAKYFEISKRWARALVTLRKNVFIRVIVATSLFLISIESKATGEIPRFKHFHHEFEGSGTLYVDSKEWRTDLNMSGALGYHFRFWDGFQVGIRTWIELDSKKELDFFRFDPVVADVWTVIWKFGITPELAYNLQFKRAVFLVGIGPDFQYDYHVQKIGAPVRSPGLIYPFRWETILVGGNSISILGKFGTRFIIKGSTSILPIIRFKKRLSGNSEGSTLWGFRFWIGLSTLL